jgi:hypothetical protein
MHGVYGNICQIRSPRDLEAVTWQLVPLQRNTVTEPQTACPHPLQTDVTPLHDPQGGDGGEATGSNVQQKLFSL